jgi:hypothetical protein
MVIPTLDAVVVPLGLFLNVFGVSIGILGLLVALM